MMEYDEIKYATWASVIVIVGLTVMRLDVIVNDPGGMHRGQSAARPQDDLNK
jgi:hypothetical protein